jgi:ferredoxin
MKVRVDPDLCTGCGVCIDMCPEVFQLQDDVSVVLVDTVPPEHEDIAREAAEACPVEAISVDEA